MMKKKSLFTILLPMALIPFFFYSCKTVPVDVSVSASVTFPDQSPVPAAELSRYIAAKGKLTPNQLADFFLSHNQNYSRKYIVKFATYYVNEAAMEGINSDVAFAQMCLETGYLKFGNLVKPEMHNYCGLGSMDKDHPGEIFKNEQMGIRAHIQHLHAYGTKDGVPLHNQLIDNRYKYVKPRGKAPTIFELAGTWAMDPNYAAKLERNLQEMEKLL